ADARASFSGLDVALGIPVVTPGLLGDFDQSGSLDIADIDALTAAVMVGTDLSFDVNTDGALNDDDRKYWIGTLKNTYTGDANLDGEFGSGDLVTVFSAGLYETGNAAGWAQGDWNGDGQFDTGDLVAAFSEGGYEAGPKAAVAAVPEPASWVILASAFCLLPLRRRG
ncbi:MAG: hypothetical protein KDB23_15065, partial [Planctomycetales bacterium]|nr:hypothetical protein [Planctomycetales bacterium]